MKGRSTRLICRSFILSLAIFMLLIPVAAQADPDPNSPTPVLLTADDSIRVLTSLDESDSKILRGSKTESFALNSKIKLFVTNVELLKGEEGSAFRVYVDDSMGRSYRFPVEGFRPVNGMNGIYELTVLLRDDLGFWDEAPASGDLGVRVTWRGIESNQAKLALGRTGGDFKFDESAVPMPLKDFGKGEAVEPPTSEYVGYKYSGDRIRFLEQATFGPNDALDQRIRRIGLRVWLAEQFEAPYPSPGYPYPDLELKSGTQSVGCPEAGEAGRVCRRDYYSQYLTQQWFFKESLYGNAQLKHRTAWSLGQIWVVSGVDTQQASHLVAYHKILSKHAFGNYRDLMYDMTLNPGMGNYLDMARSTRNNPNENYAREILQLFSVGLFMLKQDGTLQLDGNNQPIPTYNQATVNNFTKVLTGWTFCSNGLLPACSSAIPGTVNYKDPMLLNQGNHDITAKTLLGYTNAVHQSIPAGLDGNIEINRALDNIFNHPNVAPFVSRILIQHMITSDPTPAFVGRISAVFNNNGAGVRGDLKAVIKAILLDPEARGDVKTDPHYGKLREPVQFTTNILRQFRAGSLNLTTESDGIIAQVPAYMGQTPFYPPTVFNYYSPDYLVPGTALNGPEFGLLTTGTAVARANVGTVLAFEGIVLARDIPLGTALNLSDMEALSAGDSSGNALMDALNRKLMHGAMPAQMRQTILTAVLAVPATLPKVRAQQAIQLITTSSQYQVQR